MTQPVDCIIVDDERLARASLRHLLNDQNDVAVVAEAANVAEALLAVREYRPRLVFLDIQMPGESGFDLLKRLEHPPAIIFVTAHDQYAIRAFEVNAVDYLLKPVDPERLFVAVDRVKNALNGRCPIAEQNRIPFKPDDRVFIDSGRQRIFVPITDIQAIEADGNYTTVFLTDGTQHLTRRPLKNWASRLPDSFVQLSRSLIIQPDQVQAWEREGRGLRLQFKNRALELHLSRTAAQRFHLARG